MSSSLSDLGPFVGVLGMLVSALDGAEPNTANDKESVENKDDSWRDWIIHNENLESRGLICSICLDIFKDPHTVIDRVACEKHESQGYDDSCRECRPCMHSFCMSCITKLSKDACPLCRHRWSVRKCAPDMELRLKIEDLDIKCCNQGCSWTGKVGHSYIQHVVSECLFAIYTCKWCANPVVRHQMNDHMDICPDIPTTCGCGKIVSQGHLENHQTQACELRMIACQWCSHQTVFKDMAQHDLECQKKKVTCKFLPCRMEYIRMDDHESTCECRPVECQYCQTNVPKNSMEDHIEHKCPETMIECENKCGQSVARKSVSNHQLVCECVHIECDFQNCPWRGYRSDLQKHLEENMIIHLSCMAKTMSRFSSSCPVPQPPDDSFTYAEVCVLPCEDKPLALPVRVYQNKDSDMVISLLDGSGINRKVSQEHIFPKGRLISSELWNILIHADRVSSRFDKVSLVTRSEFNHSHVQLPKHIIMRPETFYEVGWHLHLRVGDIIDVRDSAGNWIMGEISEVRSSSPIQYLIHYICWTTRWDEWIHADSDRIAQPWSKSSGRTSRDVIVIRK